MCAIADNVELPHPELSWVVNVEVAAEKMHAASAGNGVGALLVFDGVGAVMEQHLAGDCTERIRSGLQESGWCIEQGSGDVFVQLPRVDHAEEASASVCGLCA